MPVIFDEFGVTNVALPMYATPEESPALSIMYGLLALVSAIMPSIFLAFTAVNQTVEIIAAVLAAVLWGLTFIFWPFAYLKD